MRGVFNADFNFHGFSFEQLLAHNDFDLHWYRCAKKGAQNLFNKGCNCKGISFAIVKNCLFYSGKKLGLEMEKSFLVIQKKKKAVCTVVNLEGEKSYQNKS